MTTANTWNTELIAAEWATKYSIFLLLLSFKTAPACVYTMAKVMIEFIPQN